MATDSFIRNIIREMSLDEKLGQMFMGNFCGTTSPDEVMDGVDRYKPGGLQFSAVFERFVRGGTHRLCGISENEPFGDVAQRIYEIRNNTLRKTGIPLFIGVDHEGGLGGCVLRRRNMTMFPISMGIAAAGSPELAYQTALASAQEAALIGVNMFYGPVLDINTNPANPEVGCRAFGDDAETVMRYGNEYIRAYRDAGIISTAKHFPGKGENASDEHEKLSCINLDRDRLEKVELVPFARAIELGVDTIMVSHTIFPALDGNSGLPASLSKGIITGQLREKMGYDGMIIPDTLCMFAISKNYDLPWACATCLEAGADMVFMKIEQCRDDMFKEIKKFVKKKLLTEDRINESIRRILELKHKRGLFKLLEYDRERIEKGIGTSHNRKICREVSQKSVVLIKEEEDILPLKLSPRKEILVINPRCESVTMADDRRYSHHILRDCVLKRHKNVEEFLVDEDPTEAQIYEAGFLARRSDAVILGMYKDSIPLHGQMKLLQRIAEIGKKPIVININAPYLSEEMGDASVIILGFGISQDVIDSACAVIFGEIKPSGRLPVTISEKYTKGFRLDI